MIRLAITVLIIAAAVHGELAGGLQRSLMRKRAVANCVGNLREECEDCSSVKICSYDKTVLAHYRCQDVDPAKPYCVGAGICSAEVDPLKLCSTSDDVCPFNAPGFYPDPTNCTRYYYCDASVVSYPYSCLASSNVYNQSSASCFLKRRTADCFQVDCANSRNKDKWFVYTPFPQLYFLCSASGPAMFKCPREHEVYDVNTKRCEFQCPSVGRFEHPAELTKYYECVAVTTTKIEKFEQNCHFDLVFDKIKQLCVPNTA